MQLDWITPPAEFCNRPVFAFKDSRCPYLFSPRLGSLASIFRCICHYLCLCPYLFSPQAWQQGHLASICKASYQEFPMLNHTALLKITNRWAQQRHWGPRHWPYLVDNRPVWVNSSVQVFPEHTFHLHPRLKLHLREICKKLVFSSQPGHQGGASPNIQKKNLSTWPPGRSHVGIKIYKKKKILSTWPPGRSHPRGRVIGGPAGGMTTPTLRML